MDEATYQTESLAHSAVLDVLPTANGKADSRLRAGRASDRIGTDSPVFDTAPSEIALEAEKTEDALAVPRSSGAQMDLRITTESALQSPDREETSPSPRQSEMSLVAEDFEKLNQKATPSISQISTAKQSPRASVPSSPSKIRAREDDEFDAKELVGRMNKRARTGLDSELSVEGKPVDMELEHQSVRGSMGGDGVMDIDMADAEEPPLQSKPPEPLSRPPSFGDAMTILRQKHLLNSLRNAKKNQVSFNFRRPVDPVTMNLPTYFDYVKTPMDMSTMESKLSTEKYPTVGDYYADVDLMVQNTVAFNGPSHAVTQAGQKLRDLLLTARDRLPSIDEQPPSAAEKRQIKLAQNLAIAKVEVPRRTSVQPPQTKSPAILSSDAAVSVPNMNGLIPARRESTLGDRPKRQVHPPPPKELTYPKSRSKKNKLEMQFCENLIREYMKPENSAQFAWPFLQPVDSVALNIPDYPKYVPNPMDLGSITQKLNAGQYDTSDDFRKDVELVAQNCAAFNQPGDPVHLCGQELKKRFELDWRGKSAWIKQQQISPGTRTPTSTTTPADSEEDTEDSERASEDEGPSGNRELELRAIAAEVDAAKLRIQLAQSEISKKQDQIKSDKEKLEEMTKRLTALKKKPVKRPSTGAVKQKAKKRKTNESTFGSKSAAKGNKRSGSGAGQSGAMRKSVKKKAGISQVQQEWMVNSFALLSASSQEKASKMIIENQPSVSGEQEVDLSELPPEVLLKLLNMMLKELPGPKSWHHEDAGHRKGQGSKSKHPQKSKKHKPMTATAAAARQEMLAGKLNEFTTAGRTESPEASKSCS